MIKVVIIDHYDSFVFNLYRYVLELGLAAVVVKCDQLTVQEIIDLNPSHLIFSPGPFGPDKVGVSRDLMRYYLGKVPILGVCLGSLILYSICAGLVVPAIRPRHGKSVLLDTPEDALFLGVAKQMQVGLYHSLMMAKLVPTAIKVLAYCDQGQIMVIKHKNHLAYGVQFHPESILTLQGQTIIANFLKMRYV